MRTKSFCQVCLGILALAAAYHFGASAATAQSPVSPEIATLSGSIGAREYLPLPVYRDGTTALASECQWIVSQGHVNLNRYPGATLGCEATPQAGGILLWSLTPDDDNDRSRANFLIIAVRSPGPTAAQHVSIGAVKAKYR